ncbi:hypothetical protein AUR64_09355 [Haloprofundus marisrubri]|uniref:Uncharacterized protein n=1 Tax=Haloprofundus marisrubri TaxID=1514971 RepID=A0A0W1R9U3_9EURY|nr:hypothetical protein [Haloprofundus marisrubri]KTG09826.1 hypothetical protein AUR64_09355 [Haloprofundus marisrubri]
MAMEKNDTPADSASRVVRRRDALKTLGVASGLSVVGVPLFGGSAAAQQQQQQIVVEDFEYGGQQLTNRYQFANGRPGISITQNVSRSGGQSLRVQGVDGQLFASSLPESPTAGDTFSYWVRATGGADTLNFGYAVSDPNNMYYVKIQYPGNSIFLYREVSGTKELLGVSNSGFSLQQNRWYRVVVQWGESGSHTVRLLGANNNQLTQFSGNDSQYDSGGIGFFAYLASGGTAFYDGVTKLSSNGSDGSNGNTSGSNAGGR